MNRPLIVATATFLLLLPQFNNADAAGRYDGEWTGTATSIGERCKQGAVKLTVEGKIVLGQARFERDTPNINGTVDEDGAFGATIGFQPFRGQFARDEFEGTFKSFDCEWKALLKRTGKTLRLKTRWITSTVVYTALAPNRFKDFWREWAQSVPATAVARGCAPGQGAAAETLSSCKGCIVRSPAV
jgi:hypothetical protein